jgi:hypothetical protein
MVYEVYFIENIGFQPVTIYVEERVNSPIFQSSTGSQVTIQVRNNVTVETDRVDIVQLRNMTRLRMIMLSKRTQQAPTARFAQIEVDFGDGMYVNPSRDKSREEPDEVANIENDMAVATVLDSTITSTDIFLCTISHVATADHDYEDAAIERIVASVMNIKPGIGYDVVATAQNNSWGKYKVNVMIGG